MQARGKLGFVPLVVLASFSFLALLLLLLPDGDIVPVLIYLPVVSLLAVVLYTRGIKPVDSDFPASLFWLAFVAKLMASLAYFWIITDFYGRGDANAYHRQAQDVAELLRHFDFSALRGAVVGSQRSANMVYIIGLMYVFLPSSLPGGSLMFSAVALAGSTFFYRAYRLAFPNSQPDLFRLGIFFLPSILFWTAALGKDVWLFFWSGLVSYGLANYMGQSRLTGLLWVALGLLATSFIRPHTTAFLAIAIGGAYFVSALVVDVNDAQSRLGRRLIAGALVVVMLLFSLRAGADFFGLEDFSAAEVETYYQDLQEHYVYATGGSTYQAASVFDLIGAVQGVVTVLFRPFPWEAHNAPALLSSVESVFWLVVLWFRRQVLWSRVRSWRQEPWIAFLLLYCAIMILALTSLANFGLLARQRVMFLPFFLMLFL